MRLTRSRGKRGLAGLLMAALISGCAAGVAPSPYRVTIPVLSAPPRTVPCALGGRADRCLVILEDDYRALIVELKAACLALGGTPEACQTEP